MCEFCKDKSSYLQFRVPYRTNSADDNRCEYGSPDNCDGYIVGCDCKNCNGCVEDNLYFSIKKFSDNRIAFEFYHKIKDLIINPFSEAININYCPFCGERLNDEIIDFDKCCLGRGLKKL